MRFFGHFPSIFGRPVKIWLYTICWNEEEIIPFFLAHYLPLVDKIIVYDNESDDASVAILSKYQKVEIRSISSDGLNDEWVKDKVRNHYWKEAREKADYVIITDMDEFFHVKGNGLKRFLTKNKQYSVFKPYGLNMISREFPQKGKKIYRQIKTGMYEDGWCKMGIFDPKRVKKMNFSLGCHTAEPEGDIRMYVESLQAKDSLYMLHYKFIGGAERIEKRYALLAARQPAQAQVNTRYSDPHFARKRFNEIWELRQEFLL